MRFEKALAQGPLVPSAVEDWGRFTRFVEIGDDLYAVRHIDAFENGKYLRYDRTHWIDAFGMLAGAQFGRRLSKSRRWQILAVDVAEFEAEWEAAGRSREWPLQVATAKMAKWGLTPSWLRSKNEPSESS